MLQELSNEVASCVATMETVLCFFSDFFGKLEENRGPSILEQENTDFEAALEPMLCCLDFFKNQRGKI